MNGDDERDYAEEAANARIHLDEEQPAVTFTHSEHQPGNGEQVQPDGWTYRATVTEQPARWTEQTAQTLIEGWMAHLGYTPEQIGQTRTPRAHNRTDPDVGYCCELESEGWQCWDENGEPAHPIHDLADEIGEQITWTLDALADAGLLLPPGGKTREEWDHRGGHHRRVITTYPDHSQYRGPWAEVPTDD